MMLLLPSRFSHVRLCVTLEMAAHQAPLSLGFSRQHWSGLPFPSPMHESEKWKWSRSVMSKSYQPHGLQPTRLLCPWDFPGKSTGVGCHCLLQYFTIVFFNSNECWKLKQNIKSLIGTRSNPSLAWPCLTRLIVIPALVPIKLYL